MSLGKSKEEIIDKIFKYVAKKFTILKEGQNSFYLKRQNTIITAFVRNGKIIAVNAYIKTGPGPLPKSSRLIENDIII